MDDEPTGASIEFMAVAPLRTYATLSLYALDGVAIAGCREVLGSLVSREAVRNGLHSVHCSTKDRIGLSTLDGHLRFLQDETRALQAAWPVEGVVRVTLWIFAAGSGENETVEIPASVVSWLQRLGGDVCVDFWREHAEE